MKYIVIIMPSAARELDEAYDWLVQQTPLNAPDWYNGLLDALLTLEDMPARCSLCPERRGGDPDTRQLVYGDKRHGYRIFFVIRGERVIVTHIRHTSRVSLDK